MSATDPTPDGFEVCVVRSDLKSACAPKQAIIDRMRRCQFSEEATFAMTLALEEALTNAVKHGNACDASKSVTVSFAVNEEKAVIIIRDEGPGFVPDQVPDCTAPHRLDVPNGRGIMLIKAYMDEVYYRDSGREVYMVKRRN